MTKIYKYTLFTFPVTTPITDSIVMMPDNLADIQIDPSTSNIVAWAEVDSDTVILNRRFRAIWTGVDFDRTGLAYRKTVTVGGFVYHVFEVLP